jgi:hypothetical protein
MTIKTKDFPNELDKIIEETNAFKTCLSKAYGIRIGLCNTTEGMYDFLLDEEVGLLPESLLLS